MDNRSVLITGASKGIGRAIAEKLSTDGFEVVIHFGNDEAGARQTLDSVTSRGGRGRILSFNIRERASCKSILEEDINSHGAYYGVVSNAGLTRDAAFPAMSENEWDDVIDTNLNGFYNVLHPVIMPMVRAKKGGRIVTLSSVSGIAGNRGQVNYSATKAGLIGATKSLAIELAKRNITVNCVAPGLIDTGMVTDEVYSHAKEMIPLRRMGQPEEVAGAVSYLFSDTAAYTTRQVLSVNGGMI